MNNQTCAPVKWSINLKSSRHLITSTTLPLPTWKFTLAQAILSKQLTKKNHDLFDNYIFGWHRVHMWQHCLAARRFDASPFQKLAFNLWHLYNMSILVSAGTNKIINLGGPPLSRRADWFQGEYIGRVGGTGPKCQMLNIARQWYSTSIHIYLCLFPPSLLSCVSIYGSHLPLNDRISNLANQYHLPSA